MQIGTTCGNYKKYWGDKGYEKAAEIGFTHIDFGLGWVGNCTEEEAISICKAEKALTDKAGLKINQTHGPVVAHEEPFTDEELAKYMEDIKKAIRMCHVLGCENIVVHPFMVNGWSDRGNEEVSNDTFQKNVAIVSELCDYAADYNVDICYENMPCVDFSISHPEETVAVVREVNKKNAKLCLDTGHCSAFPTENNFYDIICDLGSFIKVLHVHDTYGRADQHNIPGFGCTNWTDVIKGLNDTNYKGVFSLELNRFGGFSEEVFTAACRLSYAMSKEIIAGTWTPVF